jgi:RNA polymerase sigma-70 factor (ECF subfamily)
MDRKQLEKALEHLHTQSFGWALRCCFGEAETAAEVLQTTYLKILEGKAQYKGVSAFRTWLFSVIRFTAIDYYRSHQKSKHTPLHEMQNGALSIEDADLPGDTLSQRQAMFQKGLKQLSPQQAHILHLVFYQDCTIAQAAEIMEVRVGTARTHYERGKRQLKAWLIKVGYLNEVIE